jgi:LuxR family maltose regulon positive regulatory protein
MLLTRVKLRSRDGGAEGEQAAADVARLLRHMVPHPWMALLADVVLGEGAVERGDMAAAKRHALAAQARREKYTDAGILRRRAELLLEVVERTRLAEPLTPAERRVLGLLPTHLTDAQIAAQLFVSRNTVKTHVKSLYRKLQVSSRADAVGRARDLGLLGRD